MYRWHRSFKWDRNEYVNILTIGNFKTASVYAKYDHLKLIVQGNNGNLAVTESKLGAKFTFLAIYYIQLHKTL